MARFTKSESGITPAYAGNTGRKKFMSKCLRDHPRLRGEHNCNKKKVRDALGSPPPTRGTPTMTVSDGTETGITPAYAGNTLHIYIGNLPSGDHPRLRGEHLIYNKHPFVRVGSPPPTRGTQGAGESSDDRMGITPAYAGNTWTLSTGQNRTWDHPRLRGEHFFRYRPQLLQMGSPPPTRGTRTYVGSHAVCVGITPAYAGNTPAVLRCVVQCQDHPRLRGEHFDVSNAISNWSGSPPPTRGTQKYTHFLCLPYGITPAYAGNTCGLLQIQTNMRDHPRLRGEHKVSA